MDRNNSNMFDTEPAILAGQEGNIYVSGQQKIHNLLPLKKRSGMFEEYEKKVKKDVSIMRAIRDYGIGIVVLAFGAFMFFRNQFDLVINERFKPDIMDKVLGVMCLLYGAWRIYRGYKKNYFK